jgi:hypothetical protein
MTHARVLAILAPAIVAVATLAGVRAAPHTDRHPLDPRGVIFLQRGCNACHGIAALGVEPVTDAAPDLSFAYIDVRNRYGLSLESFLYDPPGVMRMMLASHLNLSRADRDSMVHILAAVYGERRASMDSVVPSFPPAAPRRTP